MTSMRLDINKPLRGIHYSPTLGVNEQIAILRRQGKTISHFGFGQSPFPAPTLFQNALAECAHQNQYLPAVGYDLLRQAIAEFHQHFFKDDVTPQQVMIGPGSKELLFQSLMLLEGPLLLPTPNWVSYGPQAKILNKSCITLETSFEEGYLLAPEKLEAACQKIGKGQNPYLEFPNNPTGRLYEEERLQAIAKVCQQHQVIVISDEIYALLSFEKFSSIKTFYPEGTFITSGLSKAFSGGGYRLGYCIMPSGQNVLRKTWEGLISETYSCVATPIQYAAHALYSSIADVLPYINQCTALLEAVCHYSEKKLSESSLNCLKTQGGFYLFPDFNNFKEQLSNKNITTNFELADHLLKNYQVAVLPGKAFYMPDDHFSVRIAPVDFNGRELLSQSFNNQQLSEPQFIANSFPNVVRGLERISEFVSRLS